MLFMALGLKNAWRSIGRSSIAIISVAFAIALITYSLSLGRGAPPYAFAPYRGMIGGDISVYGFAFNDIKNYNNAERLMYQRLTSSPFTDLERWHRDLFTSGFLNTRKSEDCVVRNREIPSFQHTDNVKAVYPRYQFPVLIGGSASRSVAEQLDILKEANLRGRIFPMDDMQLSPLANAVCYGRWFEPDDYDKFVCVIPNNMTNIPGESLDIFQRGHISVHIPEIFYDGDYVINFSSSAAVELEVIGVYEIQAKALYFKDSNGIDQMEQLYWLTDEILVPYETWLGLWALSSSDAYYPQQYALLLENMDILNDTLSELRGFYPDYGFMSVIEQLNHGIQNNHLLTRSAHPQADSDLGVATENDYFQEDLRLPIAILLVMTSALVITANLLIMVFTRKKEIAVLKAIGTERYQIVIMILSEAFCLVLIGTLVGFIAIWLQHFLNQMRVTSVLDLLPNMLVDFLLVLAISSVATALFSCIPAQKAASESVMVLLRNE